MFSLLDCNKSMLLKSGTKKVALPILGTNKLKTAWTSVIFQHKGVASGLIGPLLGHDLHCMSKCDVQSSGCLIARC